MIYIQNIFGYKPKNIILYQIAFTHKSFCVHEKFEQYINNERLEYLGDAVLGSIIAEFCFKKYPFEKEGFLTEMRSKIVNREQLNHLSKKLEMHHYIQKKESCHKDKFIAGNTFEAFIGALYLDQGYEFTQKIVIQKIINLHLDVDSLKNQVLNYKSKLLIWIQKEKKQIEFKRINTLDKYPFIYHIELYIDNKLITEGESSTIKKAEEVAAEKACLFLEI